jgi:phage gp36-like protein
MPYCTQNDLENLIPMAELAELSSENGAIPNALVIAEMIDRVTAEIDSYVSVRYAVPFDSIPVIIKGLALDMVIYHLYSRRSAVPPIRRLKYEESIRFLQDVALGKINILDIINFDNLEKSSKSIEFSSNERIFFRNCWGIY